MKAPLKPMWTNYLAQTRRDIGETTGYAVYFSEKSQATEQLYLSSTIVRLYLTPPPTSFCPSTRSPVNQSSQLYRVVHDISVRFTTLLYMDNN